ncbi:MAG: outer membrane protein assembly factor BamD [Polyangiaceae bacterium]
MLRSYSRRIARMTTAMPLLVTVAVSSLTSMGCESTPPPSNPLKYTEEAKKAYDEALEAFLDRDWEEARTLLNEVRRKYSFTKYARLAELRLADIDFEQEKFTSAITSYRTFSKDHRTDESVPYARYRICRALVAQISDTVLLPPQEERDQAATVDAYRELTAFVEDYPTSKWIAETRFMLFDVTGRLVRHELYVARYYLKQDRFEASARRVQYALRNYESSGLEPEALVLLAEIYLKMKKTTEAREVLNQVVQVYPKSPFVVPAKRFLQEMNASATR